MTKRELDDLINAEERRLGVSSEEFCLRHQEIMARNYIAGGR